MLLRGGKAGPGQAAHDEVPTGCKVLGRQYTEDSRCGVSEPQFLFFQMGLTASISSMVCIEVLLGPRQLKTLERAQGGKRSQNKHHSSLTPGLLTQCC